MSLATFATSSGASASPLATIRRTLGDDDDVVDVFAEVCANLSANGLTRLLRHDESAGARFSTWLVAVVHHQTIDWVRQREGRHRVRPPAGLSRLQHKYFSAYSMSDALMWRRTS